MSVDAHPDQAYGRPDRRSAHRRLLAGARVREAGGPARRRRMDEVWSRLRRRQRLHGEHPTRPVQGARLRPPAHRQAHQRTATRGLQSPDRSDSGSAKPLSAETVRQMAQWGRKSQRKSTLGKARVRQMAQWPSRAPRPRRRWRGPRRPARSARRARGARPIWRRSSARFRRAGTE